MTSDKPKQNRVHADGSLVASRARGTLMGNRGGRLHDPQTQTLKRGQPWANRRWISCVLAFKGRQRTVWGDGYTELFFLDEVTALAAGHRPCFECRRTDAKAFQASVFQGLSETQGWVTAPRVDDLDRCLHAARTDTKPKQSLIRDLPIGALWRRGDLIAAKTPTGPRAWSLSGYTACTMPGNATVQVLTPGPMLAALRAGYQPQWHPSALQ